MGIRMIEDRGLICPQIFCDICKRRIEVAVGANIEYASPVGETILFVHKQCDRSGSEWYRRTGVSIGWRSLDEFLKQLCHPENVKTSFSEEVHSAAVE